MSRFFAAESSSSGSETSSDSDDDKRSVNSDFPTSDEDSDSSEASSLKGPKKTGASKWMKKAQDSDDGSDDEDKKKVVKSARDKRFDEMRGNVEKMHNALKIRDWISVHNEFEKLQKGLLKADAVVLREGVPRFYIRAFCALEDSMNICILDKETIKKMNPSTSKAFNTMKQKIKKEQKLRESEIEKFKADPVDELDSADEADELAEKKAAGMVASTKKVTIHAPEDLDDLDFVEVGKGGKAVVEAIIVNVFEKLDIIFEARGKKNTDKLEQVDNLVELLNHITSPFQHICVLNALIPTRFDYVPYVSGCMSTEIALAEIKKVYDLLEEHSNITIGSEGLDDDESDASKEKKVEQGVNVVIRGNVASFVDRLDDEFFKSLQSMDPHTAEYIERLRDETALYSMIVRAQKYAESNNAQQDNLDLMMMRRVEHLYYKPDSIIQKIEVAVGTEYPQLAGRLELSENLVAHFCTILCKTSIDRIRTRALLCHVYHLALHDQFYDAKHTLLMSHLQDTISQTDVSTQTLYNRTMIQIGLCAFRIGCFGDSHTILQEISSSGKTKELLAQGVSMQKYSERTPEQEKLDKSRQLPFHMHVNLELLECVYLVSAMLLEIPNIALHTHDSRRKMISKSFRRMLEYSERQVFTGPPENNRDQIMAASKEMGLGRWKEATEFITSVKVWDLLPNADRVKEMLSMAIQEESLRTYVFNYARFYESFSIEALSSMFDLSQSKVKNIISKMIYQEHLLASLDGSQQNVILNRQSTHASNVTKMEHLAGYYSEKISILSDANDKLIEAKNQAAGVVDQASRRGPKIHKVKAQ